jgi:transposase
MSFQGVEFSPEMRKMVVNAKQFFDNLKTTPNALGKPASQLAASALDISESTVKVIMAAFNKKGEEGLSWSKFQQRGRPTYSVEPGIEPIVRQFIRKANRNGDQVNIEIIRQFMRDNFHCEVSHTTLWRALQRWGFEFGTEIRSTQLKESERVVILRRQYLRLIRANRGDNGQTDRPEVYLDESYINKNHSNDNTWYFEEDGIVIGKPTGKGDRLIIVNAITKIWMGSKRRACF